MTRVSLRRLVVAGEVYLWRRRHVHIADYETSPCCEEIIVYREGCRNSPLRLLFREDDNKLITDNAEPGQWFMHGGGAGCCWFASDQQPAPDAIRPSYNFNRPAVIACLIAFFLAYGWRPAATTRPFKIEDAMRHLNTLHLPTGEGN